MADTKYAFHDWLFASAYVKGSDQTSRVVSKKKHRSKRNPAISDMETARIEAEERIRVAWKLSNRHYRRWMNDRLLRELAPPLDAQEIGSLFAPPPWGEKSVVTPLERLTTVRQGFSQEMAAWEPFRNNVDMDAEAKLLQHRDLSERKKQDNDVIGRHTIALKAWRNIPHRLRDALRRSSSWDLVGAFEETILDFLGRIEMGGPTYLLLDVGDSYHRMLLHGICEFYGLSSQTVPIAEDKEGDGAVSEAVHVRVRSSLKAGKLGEHQERMPITLIQFLAAQKAEGLSY